MNTVAIHDWDGRIGNLVKEVADSPFQRVVLCVEERHVKFRAGNVIDAVTRFKDAGIGVVLDPWAVGGIFAGESLGTDLIQFESWLELYKKTPADAILIDEPNTNYDLDFLVRMCDGSPVILGLQPERDFTNLPTHSELMVSTYFFPPRLSRVGKKGVYDQILDWHFTLPPEASVWVQTWLLDGHDWLPELAVEIWQGWGREINVWSWEACATVSSICSPQHERVWQGVLRGLKHD